jgi:hypothetical protein
MSLLPSQAYHCAVTVEVTQDPTWQTMPARRPWQGLALLVASIIGTLAVLIYFGAWFAEDRVQARSAAGETAEAQGEWWEDGLIAICPVHG